MPEKFRLFPELPVELRLQIWSLYLHEPKTIRLHTDNRWGWGNTSIAGVKATSPILMQVNKESRSSCLAYNHRLFVLKGTETFEAAQNAPSANFDHLTPYQGIGVLLNPDVDQIEVDDATLREMAFTHAEECCRLRYVRIKWETVSINPADMADLLLKLQGLRKLENVTRNRHKEVLVVLQGMESSAYAVTAALKGVTWNVPHISVFIQGNSKPYSRKIKRGFWNTSISGSK